MVSPETSLRSYHPLVDLVGARCGRKAQFITRGSYAEIEDLLRQEQCDVTLVCTYVYVRGQRDFGLQALAAPVIHGASSYHSVIIAPHGAQAGGLLDLHGRRFASSDLLSTSGWIWPAQWLRGQGRDPALTIPDFMPTSANQPNKKPQLSLGFVWCAGGDSNPHEFYFASTSS